MTLHSSGREAHPAPRVRPVASGRPSTSCRDGRRRRRRLLSAQQRAGDWPGEDRLRVRFYAISKDFPTRQIADRRLVGSQQPLEAAVESVVATKLQCNLPRSSFGDQAEARDDAGHVQPRLGFVEPPRAVGASGIRDLGDSIEKRQIGLGRSLLVQQAPLVPEDHLDLVERREVVDQVVPELRPASRLLDVEIWGDNERLWIGLAPTAGPPRGAGDEEAVPRNVERIDEGAVVRVDVLVAELGVDQAPAAALGIADLGHLVVDPEGRNEVSGKADPSTTRDSETPRHREEQNGEVATASEEASLWHPLLGQRPLVELEQALEHGLRVAAVDL